jgi:branched-chain amino acid transport system permease protein
MSDFLQLSFAGLSQGGVYALIAIGFVAIFTVSGVINLVQGEFAALAGLIAISAAGSGIPLLAPCSRRSPLWRRRGARRAARDPAGTRHDDADVAHRHARRLDGAEGALLLIWVRTPRGSRRSRGRLRRGRREHPWQEVWILVIAAASRARSMPSTSDGSRQGVAACAEQPVPPELVGISLAARRR